MESSAEINREYIRAVPACPTWLAGAALVFLFLRPVAGLSGGFPFVLPAAWEHVSLLLLAFAACMAATSWKGLAGILISTAALNVLSSAIPVPAGIPWLFLLLIAEAVIPELVPPAWCLFWAALPAFSASLIGEPLSPGFLAISLALCGMMVWRTTLDRWRIPEQKSLSGWFLLVGLACGATLILLRPPLPEPLNPQATRVIFDERAGSGESSLGSEPSRNGHQILYNILTEAGIETVRITDRTAPLSPASKTIRIVILPDRPISPERSREWLEGLQNGEGLLFVLDHTDMDGAASRLSPLFARLGIADAFTTVDWPGQTLPGCGISGVLGNITGHPGTGGSLKPPVLWFPAAITSAGPHPLVWVDQSSGVIPGSPSADLNNQLGQQTVRTSGINPSWLGAWGRFGNGNWAVLADSSWFQNDQIAQNLPFLHNLLSLLSSGTHNRLPWAPLFAILISLFGLARHYRIVGKPALPAGLIIGLAFALWAERQMIPTTPFLKRPPAIVLLPESGDHQLSARQPDSFYSNIDTLCSILLESGWEPYIQSSIERIPASHSLCILMPADKPTSKPTLERLDSLLDSGANLLLWVDGHSDTGKSMLRRYGFTAPAGNELMLPWASNSLGLPEHAVPGPHQLMPTGSMPAGIASGPLWSDRPYPILNGDAWYRRSDGLAVISHRSFRNGSVIAVSDPTLFSNGALHVPDTLDDPAKRTFLNSLLRALLTRKAVRINRGSGAAR